MAAIASWLAGLVASLIPVVAGFIGKKFAMATVYISVFIVLGAAMLAGVSGLLSGISVAFPSSFTGIFGMFPPNTALCISAIITTNTVIAAYDAHMTLLKIKIES